MEDRTCVIPRNLNTPDKIMHFRGVGLTKKHLLYITVGGFGAYALCQLNLPWEVKMSGSILAVGLSGMLSLAKFRGQQAEEVFTNSITYVGRKRYYNSRKKAMVHEGQHSLKGSYARTTSVRTTGLS